MCAVRARGPSRAYSSAVEPLAYNEVVGGSIPSAPTPAPDRPREDPDVTGALLVLLLLGLVALSLWAIVDASLQPDAA